MSMRLLRRLRWITQGATLIIFLYVLFETRSDSWAVIPVDIFFRLNPLAASAAMVASRQVISALLLSLATVVITIILGRVWCGWLCPMGTVLDLASTKKTQGSRPALPQRWRFIKYGLLIAILGAALAGNQTLLILDPITLLTRTTTTIVWPALDLIITALEKALYSVGFLRSPIVWFDAMVRGPVLPLAPRTFQGTLLIAGIFAGVLVLNRFASRFWCRYLCPLGGLLGLLSRIAPLRRQVNERCIQCKRCANLCPTGTIDATAGYSSDPAECTMCLDCHVVCPANAIDFRFENPTPLLSYPYDPKRRSSLGALGLGLMGAVLSQLRPAADRVQAWLIRPPGGRENNLPQKCIRCGICLKVCPTGGLQPAWSQDAPEGVWTPVLVPRIGYCDYSCNACGRICPTGAIPNLELDVKRTVVIGKAYIDQNRCIPWSDNRSCIVCEEMCPVPNKAIKLAEVEVTDQQGNKVTIGRPHVERERCIGCGICEYQCPVAGEAAIRVYYPTDIGAGPGA